MMEKEVPANGNPGEEGLNSAVQNGVIENTSFVPVSDRIKRKAKRPSKYLTKEHSANGSGVVTAPRALKNSRRPRNKFGRGLPKKGGAGGKGVWGKPGQELDEARVDVNDPNYDSDSIETGDVSLQSFVPDVSEEELVKWIEPVILEYFENGDTEEVCMSFDEFSFGKKKHFVLSTGLELAMDRKPSQREMMSVLIADMYNRVMGQREIAKGFDMLLKNLPDLVLDTPEAPDVLGNFIARAIADDCIPPRFITDYKGKVECELTRQALSRAETLLSMKHGLVRLDNVWGVGGGTRPVKYLIKKICLLLQEYLSSGDLAEAERCLLDLEVPHFHHEMVYEALVMALEAIDEHTEDEICKLLKSLYSSVIITPEQMQNGFLRVFEEMPEIALDVPSAYNIMERLLTRCQEAGFITQEFVNKFPARGRKRFVSEGDGGRIKMM